MHRGRSRELAAAFGVEAGARFWGRHYVFYLDGRPLTVVYEVFSPALDRYLGASDATGPASPAANGRGPGVGSGGS